jgi:hypothetical protein
MRRAALAVTLCLLTALAVAGGAWGLISGDYKGHVRGDPLSEVSFQVNKSESGRKRIEGFTIHNVTYTCEADPDGRTDGHVFLVSMRVRNDGTFSGEGEWTTAFADPTGKVRGVLNPPKAHGSFRVRGDLAGKGTDCRTGLQEWKAEKDTGPTG